MKRLSVLAAALVVLALASSALAQGQVEIRSTTPDQGRHFEIIQPSPATREASKPREADFYRDDIRVRHVPAFIEPFTTVTKGGTLIGASGWTAPATPVGSLVSQGNQQTNGWFSLGITFIWDWAPAAGPVSAPR